MTKKPTIKLAIDQATRRLTDSATETPRLDAEVLMSFELRWPRSRLFAHWDEDLRDEATDHYMHLVERRAAGEPVAYIRNLKEFLGLEFYVDSRVLIPRPETELLVSRAVAWLENEKLPNEPNHVLRTQHSGLTTAVDVGTGSGAVAIGIAKHISAGRVIATDVSPDALNVARINAGRHGVELDLRQGSLLEPLDRPVDLIVANLPYLSRDEYERLQGTSIGYEPRLALTDDADGLQLFAALFAEVPAKLAPGGCLLLEIGSDQPGALQRLAKERLPDFDATVFADYAGLPRVLQLQR